MGCVCICIGKGRTVTCIAAYLAWVKYNDYSPAKALVHVCEKMKGSIQDLTIPSQTRYLSYLTNVLIKKALPKMEEVIIESIEMKGIPIFQRFHKDDINDNEAPNPDENENNDETKDNNDNNVNNEDEAPKMHTKKKSRRFSMANLFFKDDSKQDNLKRQRTKSNTLFELGMEYYYIYYYKRCMVF